MIALLLALQFTADTLPLDLVLQETGESVRIEAVLTLPDSGVWLPTDGVHALLGVTFASPYVTARDIEAAYPTVTVRVALRLLQVIVSDPQRVLPGTRGFFARVGREGRGAPPLAVTRGGPFAAFAADDSGRSVVEVGYSWRLFALAARQSSTRGPSWSVGVAPWPSLFVSASQYPSQAPQGSARLARGPVWVQTRYDGQWSTDGLLSVGPLSLFASTQDQVILTYQSPLGGLQLARSHDVNAVRLSVGNTVVSPFAFPFTQ